MLFVNFSKVTQFCDTWVEIVETYHLILIFNFVIIIKATS